MRIFNVFFRWLCSIIYICIFLIGVIFIYEIIPSSRGLGRADQNVRRADWMVKNVQFDATLGWVPIPNRLNTNEWGNSTSNSLGFRSEEIDKSKKHIIILGGSVGYSFGVGDEETMLYYLNQKLKPFNYQVSNLAVPGYGIDQEYLILQRHINRFINLKYVILIISANDSSETASNFQYFKRKPLYALKENELVLTNIPIKKYDFKNIVYMSKLLKRLSRKYKGIKNLLNYLVREEKLDREETKKVISLLLERIYGLAVKHDAKLIVVFSPPKEWLANKLQNPSRLPDFLQDNNSYPLINFNKILNDHYINSDKIYCDFYHLSEYGNELLAETLFKNIDIE